MDISTKIVIRSFSFSFFLIWEFKIGMLYIRIFFIIVDTDKPEISRI